MNDLVWQSQDGSLQIIRDSEAVFSLIHNGNTVISESSWPAVVNYAWAEFHVAP